MTDLDFEYDQFSYEQDEDPYPVYARMRDEAPTYYNARQNFFALTRFDDVLAALVDSETYSSLNGTSLEFMDTPKPDSGLIIFMDPPRHSRYRNLVSKAFTPRSMAEIEPEVRRIACAHLDALAGRSELDLVGDFTSRLPMDVISALLGIPESDRREVQRKSNLMLHREPGNPLPTQEAIAASGELLAYISKLIAERRARPQDDLLTRLTQVEVADERGELSRLDDSDVRMFFVLLATAGNETVMKLLATMLHELWRRPDQRDVLVREPRWIANAVEEALRFDPPSQYQGRVTTRDVALHGVTIPKGAKVALVNGASGRDPRKYADPDAFDVRREIDLHLGFGYGRHVCLGAHLARMESRIGIEEFLRRFPRYEVTSTARMHSSNVRGFKSVGVRVG
ncbi:MAG: cytochrome P450 [Deltaproteobacteria bacterium]|nr:cytochrome P450 [Deltaproteobacteria bacterium]